MQQPIVKCYCFVVQTLLNMFRALLCPLSGARQTAVAASGFRMNVEVEVYKNIKQKLHKTITAIWFNKTCKHFHLHIHTETRGCNGSLTGF